jgi:hypothetical protein
MDKDYHRAKSALGSLSSIHCPPVCRDISVVFFQVLREAMMPIAVAHEI